MAATLFTRRVSAALVAAVLASSAPSMVYAQNKAAAVQLFDEAKKLMDAGNFAEACPKLEASRNMDPTADGVVLRLAACYQGMGRWASAWSLYRESLVRAEKAKRADRIAASKKGIAETEPKLSYVTVNVPASSRIEGLELKWDDKPLEPGALGIAIPVDPGNHVLVATAANRKEWRAEVTLSSSGEKKSVDVPLLEEAASPAAPPPSAQAPAPVATPAPPPAEQPTPPPSNTAAYVALGGGALLLAGGIGSYFVARTARDDYFAECAQQVAVTCDNPSGRQRVRTWEAVAFAAGGVGLAALGVGVVLLSTGSGKDKRAALTATPTVGTVSGVSLVGTF
jgi:hypothetical protein